jgi:hypothetical protein
MESTNGTELRELAHRASDGLEVALVWDPIDDTLSVVVTDVGTGDAFEFTPDRRRALEAFYHPFAVAPRRDPARRERSEATGSL